jgi:peptidoglycan/xylan/chitin deacetylase (PgdA/CDA1 family)
LKGFGGDEELLSAKVVKRLYRSVLLPSLAASGCFHLFRLFLRHRALVLMYHGVVKGDGAKDSVTGVNNVNIQSFIWQVKFLKTHYDVVPLEEIINRLRGGSPVGGLAAITFDDGYFSVYKNAMPVLLQWALPATVFIIAGLAGTNGLTWYDTVEAVLLKSRKKNVTCRGQLYELREDRWETIRALTAALKKLPIGARDAAIMELAEGIGLEAVAQDENYRLLNWREILELKEKGFSVGVHSYLHPNLSKVPITDLEREIDLAARLTSDQISVPVKELCFSYPDGDYNPAIRARVRVTGMCGAVTVREALVKSDDDLFSIPRVGIYRHHSAATFDDATVGFTRTLKKMVPN